MRELTFREQIIDAQSEHAISKWLEAFQNLIISLGELGEDFIQGITLKRGNTYSAECLELSADDPDDSTPYLDYVITTDLPKLTGKAQEIFLKILAENEISISDLYSFSEDELSMDIHSWF